MVNDDLSSHARREIVLVGVPMVQSGLGRKIEFDHEDTALPEGRSAEIRLVGRDPNDHDLNPNERRQVWASAFHPHHEKSPEGVDLISLVVVDFVREKFRGWRGTQ